MSAYQHSFRVLLAVVLVAIGSAWSDARAEAWVSDKGSLDFDLVYNLGKSDKVIGTGSLEFPDSGTTTHQLTLGAEYVPIEHLAVDVGVPLGMFKYTGNKTMYPHPGGGSYDDGSLHTTLTDLRAGARYQLLEDPIAVTPLLAVSIPLASYETIGNTVAGRHLKALHVGVAIGRLITDALYAELTYEFGIVEKYDRTVETARQGQNTSDGVLTLGYKFPGNRFDVHLGGNVHITHGGVDFTELVGGTLSPNEGLYHDAILRENQFLVGGGVGYQVTEALSLSLAARVFVSGANTQNASVYVLEAGWSAL